MRLLALGLLLACAALVACDEKAKETPALNDVELKQEFAADFAGFSPPSVEMIKNGSVSRRITAPSFDEAWQGLLAVAAQCGFIAHAERETGVVIVAALPPAPGHGKEAGRPDPYGFPPPAFFLERRGEELVLHANWNVPYYVALKANAGIALKDAEKARMAEELFNAVETQAQSRTRWPWLTGG